MRRIELSLPPGQPALRGNQRMWDVIMALGSDGASFSVVDIWNQTSSRHRQSVDRYVGNLLAAGYLAVADRRAGGRGPRVLYRLLRQSGKAPVVRRDGSLGKLRTARQQIWNILRGPQARAGITVNQLSLVASTSSVAVSPSSAKRYVIALHRGGYLLLAASGRRGPGGVQAHYRLKPSRNTGPLAPIQTAEGALFDPNLGQAIESVGDEVAA